MIIVRIRTCGMESLEKDFSDEWWSLLYPSECLKFSLTLNYKYCRDDNVRQIFSSTLKHDNDVIHGNFRIDVVPKTNV